VDFIFWKRTPLLSLEGILKNPLIASLRHFRKTFAKEKGMQTPSLCRGEGFQKTTSCDTRVSITNLYKSHNFWQSGMKQKHGQLCRLFVLAIPNGRENQLVAACLMVVIFSLKDVDLRSK